MKRAIVLLIFFLCGGVAAQTAPTPPPSQTTPPPKAKRVYTNDDMQNLSAPVNVVGSSNTSSSTATGKDSAADNSSPKSACASDSWTAAITYMAQQAGLPNDAKYWSTKLFGGTCPTQVDPSSLASRIAGNYFLDDGSKLQLQAFFNRPLPNSDVVVNSIKANKPFLVAWNGRAWLARDVGGVERVGSGSGQHIDYVLGSLTLVDLASGDQQKVDLKKQVSEIAGSILIRTAQ